jgi:hypothetical protein
MPLGPPPSAAAWRHVEARTGFEVVFARAAAAGTSFVGETAATEDGETWAVRYAIDLGADWATHAARVSTLAPAGLLEVALESSGSGTWRVDGAPAPELDGCLDVDLESSCLTNAFPVRRLGLGVGESARAPAAYVRVAGPRVERLEQDYLRLPNAGTRQRYRYSAPAFDFECELVYDELGLLLDYPGIGTRVA